MIIQKFLLRITLIVLGTILGLLTMSCNYQDRSTSDTEQEAQGYMHLNGEAPDLIKNVKTFKIDFTSQKDQSFLLSGWNIEKGHTWAVGKEAVFSFYTFNHETDKIVYLHCRAFPKLKNQTMKVFLNDVFVKEIPVAGRIKSYKVILPSDLQKYYNNVKLVFKHTGRPIDYGINDDTRDLALDFYKIEFIHEDTLQLTNTSAYRIATDNNKNLLMPLNSIVQKNVFIKPDSFLDLTLSSNIKEKSGKFKVVLDCENKTNEPFSFTPGKLKTKKSIDLSAYANQLVKLSFIYEGQDSANKIMPVVRVQAALKSSSKTSRVRYPNIIFISLDTLRADYLGCYGAEVSTPSIDKLARSGILFNRAYSHIPITLPSHTAMFTSLYPHAVGVTNNARYVKSEIVTLPEILNAAGFATSGITSLGTLERYTNFNKGFISYSDTSDTSDKLGWSFISAEKVNSQLESWFNHLVKKQNWFFFLHYSDPHEPYHGHGKQKNNVRVSLDSKSIGQLNVSDENFLFVEATLSPGKNILHFLGEKDFCIRTISIDPAQYDWKIRSGATRRTWGYQCNLDSRFEIINPSGSPQKIKLNLFLTAQINKKQIRENYIREVEYLDQKIGEMISFFNERGLLENTLLILTSDHGEGLGNHNLIGHIHQLYNTQTHVPLIISWPDMLPNGKTIDSSVRHIDLLPTILDLCNINISKKFSGESLVPLIEGIQKNNRPVLSMTFKPEAAHNLVSMIDNNYKIIKNMDSNEFELYDLNPDPEELNNISIKESYVLKIMKVKLSKILKDEAFKDGMDTSKHQKVHLNEDLKNKLRGLGYIQ